MPAIIKRAMARLPKTPSESKREESRRAIQEAALGLFYTKGFDATTTRDIVKAAGILNGSLYNRFKSKDEILMSIIADVLSSFLEENGKLLREEKDPMVSIAVPTGVELYLASTDSRMADLIYQSHKSWDAVEMLVDLYTGWLKSIWSEHFHDRIEDVQFRASLVAMMGAIGNLCGMYAHGSQMDYRTVLEEILKVAGSMAQMPTFALRSTVDKVAEIIEGGDVRVMGRSITDLQALIPQHPEADRPSKA
jgi:AcrR family transcriptional regulator